ncbi:MAG: DNA-directed RNA polymerase subunit omega [Gemmatimonadaceae bacterium]|nr:DNA-directed RNA polymerase subunit omega [Gemmatimonadaceae bacterium]
MRVFTPDEIASASANKYLGVLVAAKYARVLNDIPKNLTPSTREKKLTTRAMEELARGDVEYKVIPRRRAE